MNNNDLLVYDFETTSINPHSCQPTELASCVIHGRKLEIHPNSMFRSYIRPIFDEEECKKLGLDPVTDEVLEKTHIKKEDLEKAPSIKVVWDQFQKYVNKYNYRQGKWGSLIKCGMNTTHYDNIIIDRIAGGHLRKAKNQLDIMLQRGIIGEEVVKEIRKLEPWGFGPWDDDRQEETLFYPAAKLDLRDILWFWFENNVEVKSLSMDAMREYFGISAEKAHTADKDVEDTALLITKFLKLHRHYGPKVKFRGSCK